MKAIVIYFSRADENYFGGHMKVLEKGNTEVLAEDIQSIVNASLFEVERKVNYAKDYRTCLTEAQEEYKKGTLPPLKKYLDSVDDYDVVFIGGPIYWGTLPQPMFSQLSLLNLDGKIIMPFVTHEGSGLANVMQDLKKYAPNAKIKQCLAVVGSQVTHARHQVVQWIKENL